MFRTDENSAAGSLRLMTVLASRPRTAIPIEWRTGWRRALTWATALVMMTFGLLAALLMITGLLWCNVGVDELATVRSTYITTGSGKKKIKRYHAVADFQVAGVKQTEDFEITWAEYKRLSAAGIVRGTPSPGLRVRMLKFGSFHYAAAVSQDESPASKLFGIPVVALIGLMAIGWWGLWRAILEPRRVGRLYREGVASPGVITRKWEVDGKVTAYYIAYEFITPEGNHCKGKRTLERHVYDATQEGKPVTVLHPEGMSWPNVIYEYGGYRCE